ncbi:hypothetical protein [Bradyrhizobium sp. USDA 3256]
MRVCAAVDHLRHSLAGPKPDRTKKGFSVRQGTVMRELLPCRLPARQPEKTTDHADRHHHSTILERYFAGFAERPTDVSGSAHLIELAVTAKAAPEPLLRDLAAMLAALDSEAVASTLAVRAREVASDGLRCDDATDFVRSLVGELQGFLDEPEVMAAVLAELKRRERGTVD